MWRDQSAHNKKLQIDVSRGVHLHETRLNLALGLLAYISKGIGNGYSTRMVL